MLEYCLISLTLLVQNGEVCKFETKEYVECEIKKLSFSFFALV